MREQLERDYQLLLMAYPRRYRRHRGVEILTTLMDMTPPDRARPSFSDAVSILFGGLRKRLSLHGARKSIAMYLSVLGLTFGAAAGAYIGWQSAPDLPDNATAAEMARVAVPELPATPRERQDFLFGYDLPVTGIDKVLVPLLGGDDYTLGYVRFQTQAPPHFQASRDRLIAAGWTIDGIGERELYAHRGDYFIHVWQSPDTFVDIQRTNPPGVHLLTAIGMMLGALLGWRFTGWIGRRVRHQSEAHKLIGATFFCFGAVLALPATVFNLVGIGLFYGAPPSLQGLPWPGFVFLLVRAPATLGFLLLAVALLIVALPVPSRSPTRATAA